MRFLTIGLLAALMLTALGCYEPPTPTQVATRPAWLSAPLVACTGSMEPVISCGDRVRIDMSWDEVDLVEGVIVQFVPIACKGKDPSWYSADTVLHRIVYVSGSDDDGRRYLTRGDNNSGHDCLVDPAYIIGVVTAIYAPDGSKKPLL